MSVKQRTQKKTIHIQENPDEEKRISATITQQGKVGSSGDNLFIYYNKQTA